LKIFITCILTLEQTSSPFVTLKLYPFKVHLLQHGSLTNQGPGHSPGLWFRLLFRRCHVLFVCTRHSLGLHRAIDGLSTGRYKTPPGQGVSCDLPPSGWTFQPWLLRSELPETALVRGVEACKAGGFNLRSLTSGNSTPTPL